MNARHKFRDLGGIAPRNRNPIARVRWALLPTVGCWGYREPDEPRHRLIVPFLAYCAWIALGWLPGSRLYR